VAEIDRYAVEYFRLEIVVKFLADKTCFGLILFRQLWSTDGGQQAVIYGWYCVV
jgi:hypothetical protein